MEHFLIFPSHAETNIFHEVYDAQAQDFPYSLLRCVVAEWSMSVHLPTPCVPLISQLPSHQTEKGLSVPALGMVSTSCCQFFWVKSDVSFFYFFHFYLSLKWLLTLPVKGVNPFISTRDQQNCHYSAESEGKVSKAICLLFFYFFFPFLSPLYTTVFQIYFSSIVGQYSIKYNKIINK